MSLLHVLTRNAYCIEQAIYWEARELADEQRQQLPDWVFTGGQTKLGEYIRIWDYFTPDYNCPLLKQRVGRIGDGGKWVCGLRSSMLQTPGCLVYSLGSDGDTSFEDGMINRTACDVHTFDPTLSQEKLAVVQSRDKLHFYPVGEPLLSSCVYHLYAHGWVQTFASPWPGAGVGDPEAHPDSPLKLEKLEAIMSRLQHTWIDVLKIDIEGYEWELLRDFYKSGAKLPATQILMEVHFKGVNQVVWETFDMLLADKYRVFSVEPNYYCMEGCCAKHLIEFAFIKVSDHGQIVHPRGGLAPM